MDSNQVKAVIDLFDYVKTLGEDRPHLSVFLKELNIQPQTMWDAVVSTAHTASYTIPEASVEIVNQLFKLGVTIGYKYAIKKEMERQFPTDSNDKTTTC